ncbi:hypothetical protein U3516DRAFT_808802 [Neocallimastix sp. 'constans']
MLNILINNNLLFKLVLSYNYYFIHFFRESLLHFMIFKNQNVVIFQSPFQASLFKKYCDDLFVDGTFYWVCTKNLDFKRAISNAAIIVFPDINIRYCIWHYKHSLGHHKNKICYNEVNHKRDLYVYYNSILNLFIININNIFDIFYKIKKLCIENNYNKFLIFLEYFRKTYLIFYDIENWDYYNNIEHITNNASESFNNYLNTYERMLGKMDSFLIGNERNRSHIAGLCFECLINLNNKKIY